MTSMSDLHVKAIRAVAEVDPNGPNGKLPAIRVLRGMTDKRHTLRDYIDAVEWAMARPRHALTRADKERAVAEMAKRYGFSRIVANNVICDNSIPISHLPKWERALKRQMAALLRIAMARTVD